MTLEVGRKLGPYEILAPIGAGGMGEVYKAKDTRLGRDVAVKVLPAHMSSSAELRQRLDREAKTISQLSHPHICMLHDVGHQDGVDYLVMEFLEGETLADRLSKGAMPIDQALKIGVEIAGALDAAHKSGIIHRDLKPGNVMLTKSGVKLLDFGLAKLAVPDKSEVSQATSLPTALQESQPLTTRGTILGTFQYMAPEQLEGGEADARSDIFAFGCVLYEMLTGQKAFTGKSQASLIGSIMNSDPTPISSIQPMIPASLDRIVKGCLAKEPEQRWSTAHDVMLQLQWIAEGGSMAGVPAPVVARRKNREKLAWGVAAAAVLAVAALAVGFVRRAPKPAPLVRFDIVPPAEVATMDVPRLSPDGRLLAFDATDMEGKARIWVRPLGSLTAAPLPGTDGGVRPFWSPDSRYIGFMADGAMKKVDVTGGPPTTQNLDLPYAVPNMRVSARALKATPIRLSNLRAPGKIGNVFAVESFIDELAAAAQTDPVAFRRRGLSDPRAIAVLERAAAMIGWQPRPSPSARSGAGGVLIGRGIAYIRYKQAENYVATAMEVAVDTATGKIAVRRIACAHDCGLIVNPDGLRNQVEGNILHTLSRTLHEEIKFDGSRVTTVDWAGYPILRFPEAPAVEVALIDHPDQPSYGAGEAACAPVAAALGNAIFDATGLRLRSVPFTAARVKAALAVPKQG
jgi:hypothetical protein